MNAESNVADEMSKSIPNFKCICCEEMDDMMTKDNKRLLKRFGGE
jgi:hypothetical protein